MNKPPVFPIAAKEYDADQINNMMRILTQYLNQTAVVVSTAEQKNDTDEILIWLS